MRTTETAAFIYARLDSRRLPGKPLIEIDGVKVIDAVYARAARLNVDAVVVLTTGRRLDDPISIHCAQNGYQCFRGDPTDLVKRTVRALETYGSDRFVRVNGDCPLFEPTLVNAGLSKMDTDSEIQVLSNVLNRTFPYGVAVECIEAQTYLHYSAFAKAYELEHVTQHLNRLSKHLHVCSMLDSRGDSSSVRLTLDTVADLYSLRQLCSAEDLVYLPYWQLLGINRPSPVFEKNKTN